MPTNNALERESIFDLSNTNKAVNGITVALTKFGTVVATVARMLEPKSSAATVMNKVQYPLQKPRNAQITYNMAAVLMGTSK